jgi:hypothetical protein
MFHLTIEGINSKTFKTFSYDLVYNGDDNMEFFSVILNRVNFLAQELSNKGFEFEAISETTANWSHKYHGSIVIILETL